MAKSFVRIPLLLLAASLFVLHAAPRGAYNDTTGEGKALVEELLSRGPAEDSEIQGLLKIRAPNQPLYEIPVTMITKLTANGWDDIYRSAPVLHHPAEILIIKHRFGAPNEYYYSRGKGDNAAPEPEKISTNSIWQPFAGSDFYLADLGLQFFHWDEHKIVQKEMRKGRSCRVVESINPDPDISEYSRVLSWLDYETGNLILAEGYDHQNELLKEFSVRKVSRQEDRVQVKEIEIRNDRTDSRTRLEFNYEFEE